ncbi:MAG: replication-relaxation family protein [Burkholderiales bacterium]
MPDDVDLLRLVDQHRLITSRQLLAALGGERDERAFLQRLAKLFHAEYLDRPPAQNRPGQPARHFIYALGVNGHRTLFPKLWEHGRPRDVRLENRRLKLQSLQHEVAVCETVLALHLAAHEQGWTFAWSKGSEFHARSGFPARIKLPSPIAGVDSLPLNPDAFVTVRTGEHNVHWFVEVDMSTEPQITQNLKRSSICQKVLAYWTLNVSRLAKFDRKRDSFRALFVTTTAARLQGMRTAAQAVDAKRKGAHFFHFTTQENCSLNDPGKVFYEPVWWTAKQGYDNPRKLFLDTCMRCHQLVDTGNEPYVLLNSDPPALAFAPGTTPLPDMLPDEPEYAHAQCPGR